MASNVTITPVQVDLILNCTEHLLVPILLDLVTLLIMSYLRASSSDLTDHDPPSSSEEDEDIFGDDELMHGWKEQ